MAKLTKELQSIFDRLKAKANCTYGDGSRMPSIMQICKLLAAYNIEHKVSKSVNIVEYRSKGKMYVNSRHTGKKGFELHIQMDENTPDIHLDTSSSYYSHNTWSYAKKLIELIESRQSNS